MVMGNCWVNLDVFVLVVVVEIFLNCLLYFEVFDFGEVLFVVMDEFYSFNDLECGIVWELMLYFFFKFVCMLFFLVMVGNSVEFVGWFWICYE